MKFVVADSRGFELDSPEQLWDNLWTTLMKPFKNTNAWRKYPGLEYWSLEKGLYKNKYYGVHIVTKKGKPKASFEQCDSMYNFVEKMMKSPDKNTRNFTPWGMDMDDDFQGIWVYLMNRGPNIKQRSSLHTASGLSEIDEIFDGEAAAIEFKDSDVSNFFNNWFIPAIESNNKTLRETFKNWNVMKAIARATVYIGKTNTLLFNPMKVKPIELNQFKALVHGKGVLWNKLQPEINDILKSTRLPEDSLLKTINKVQSMLAFSKVWEYHK